MTNLPNSRPLVDEVHLRSSVMKRLFQRTVPAIVGELLQNSQRARATEVRITTEPENRMISYKDNGHGILNGRDGWWNLLAIASSYYENPEVQNQDPMGLGLNALLTAEEVEQVVILSGGCYIHIDTHRWWNEPDYYNNWEAMICRYDDFSPPVEGFQITIFANDAKFVNRFEDCLALDSFPRRISTDFTTAQFVEYLKNHPALGYEDYLSISLNNGEVYPGIPSSGFSPILETIYEGNKLVIGLDGISIVRWYGQLIMVKQTSYAPRDQIMFYLDVKEGTPLTPEGADRHSIMKDEKLTTLKQFVINKLFEWAESDDSAMTMQIFDLLGAIDKPRLLNTSAWFTYRIKGERSRYSYGEIDSHTSYLAKYSNPPEVFLNRISIRLVEGNEEIESALVFAYQQDYGMTNFLEEMESSSGEAIEFRVLGMANTNRLSNIKYLSWFVGEPHERMNETIGSDIFYSPGSWAITEEDPDLIDNFEDFVLNPFKDDASLYFFSTKTSNSFETAEWSAIGTDDPVYWLSNEADVAESEDGDCDEYHNPDEESFYDSIQRILREYRGDVISSYFTSSDLRDYIARVYPDPESSRLIQILSVEYVYAENNTYDTSNSIKITFRRRPYLAEPKEPICWGQPIMVEAKLG